MPRSGTENRSSSDGAYVVRGAERDKGSGKDESGEFGLYGRLDERLLQTNFSAGRFVGLCPSCVAEGLRLCVVDDDGAEHYA